MKWLCCAVLTISLACCASAETSPPNILFIYTDDQGPQALGASGNDQIKTPNMDRLFRAGAHLVNAFVTTPVCSPARVGVIASRYGSEVGITDWISESHLGLDPAVVTWPKLLQRAGYRTGLVGKWHLGTLDKFHPTKMGYDYFMGFRAGGTRTKDPTLQIDGRTRKFQGLTVDVLTDHAIEFLRRNRDRRFALSLHHRAPHAAYLPVAPEDWTPYDKLDPTLPDYPDLQIDHVKKRTREYYASVTGIDRNLGRVLAALDELKLADKTVVIFTSDHGYNLGDHGLWYKGNAFWVTNTIPPQVSHHVPAKRRPNMFDTSLRVPAAVRWPGVIAPGTVVRRCVTNLDWYPTLLAMAAVELPPGVTIRGRSFLPLLTGEDVPGWSDEFYAEYSMHHGARTQMRTWRTPQWKLTRDLLSPQRDELYDLSGDPLERTNLIGSTDPRVAKARAELDARLRAHIKRIGASRAAGSPAQTNPAD